MAEIDNLQYKVHKSQSKLLVPTIQQQIEQSSLLSSTELSHLQLLKTLFQLIRKNPSESHLELLIKIAQQRNISAHGKTLLKKSFSCFPVETVQKKIETIPGLSAINPIFNVLDKKLTCCFKSVVKTYLSSFLQDKSVIAYLPWFNEVVDQDYYKDNIHQQIIKLINRNSQNMDIFKRLLQVQKLDFSPFVSDYFELLKEHFLDDTKSEKSVGIMSQVLSQSSKIEQKNIESIKSLISKTFNEKQKISMLPMIAQVKTPQSLEFILQQTLNMQAEESLPLVAQTIKELPADDTIFAFIKKSLASNNAKLVSVLLKILNQAEKSDEIRNLVKTTIVQNYIKTPSKVLSNYQTFLPAISLMTDSALLPDLLNPDLFINKVTFHQKATKEELAYLLTAYTSLYDPALSQSQHWFMAGVIFQMVKNRRMSSAQIVKSFDIKAANLLVLVLFIQQFYQEIEHFEVNALMQLLVKYVSHVDKTYYYEMLYAVYGPKNTRKLQLNFLKQAQPIREKIIDDIKENQQTYLFLAMHENSSKTFCQLFCDFQCDFYLPVLSPMFILENYKVESEEIQNFDVQYKAFNGFIQKVTYMSQILKDNSFIEKTLPFIQIQNKNEIPVQQKAPVPASKGAKKQTKTQEPSKKEKIEFFDEESIKVYQKNLIKNLAIEYLNKISPIAQSLVKNQEIAQSFFKSTYPELLRVSEIPESYEAIFDILVSAFHSQELTKDHAYQLSEVVLKIIIDETQEEENVENLMQFLTKLQKVECSPLMNFFKSLVNHLLKNKNFERKIKREAIHAMLNLLKTDQNVDENDYLTCYRIFVDNVNNLGPHPKSEELFFYLVLRIDQQHIKLIFKDLLNLNLDAQNLMLKSLLLEEVQGLPANFEMFVTLKIIIGQQNTFAEQVFKKVDFAKKAITDASVEEFDLYRFLTSNAKENTDQLCQIIAQEIQSKTTIALLVTKTVDCIRRFQQYDLPEELLLFLPILLNSIELDSKQYSLVFETMIEIACLQDYPNLFEACLKYSVDLIKAKGNHHSSIFLFILDPKLEQKISVQQQIFVLVNMGVLAPFIQNKEKVNALGKKILNLLKLPDEHIQKSISKCIPDLFIFFEDPKQLVKDHLSTLFTEKSNEIQRGQAYLVSGLVKGLGVGTIEELGMEKYFPSEEEKRDVTYRLGQLHLLYAFQENLQKVFEPYFLHFFDFLLPCFAESNEQIRSLAIQVCKLGMGFLSSYGVGLLLPKLLKSLEERPQWRSKIANLWALGNMAYCSPKTLSSCLPQVVPVLSNAISDTHPKIQVAANDALTLIGTTIRNPELTLIVDVIIKALSNPFDENKKGLNILLKTEFAHFIDVPALSLIIPVIEYALTSKDQTSKEEAGKIVATITYLIKDPKDLLPYLQQLIMALMEAISDHLTEVRTIAAKAFGQLAKKLTVTHADTLKTILFDVLNSEQSTSVQRAGAAQALSESLYNLGIEQFAHYLPYILKQTNNAHKGVKEGYIGMFIFFPQIMDKQFEKYISVVLDGILISISDPHEPLRNLALRVIRVFIQKYGNTQLELLLDPVLEGAFSDDALRRASCGLLMDDILKNVEMNKDGYYDQTIVTLYVLRHDFVDSIKSQATNAWKANIDNTPKTLKKLLKVLIHKLCQLKALNSEDMDVIIHACISEFIEKYQEQCLYATFDYIDSYAKEHPTQKWAAFSLLEEVLASSERSLVLKQMDRLVEMIRENMADPSELLRKYVFTAFKVLLQKARDTESLGMLVQPLLDQERPDNYDLNLLIFSELLHSESDLIIDYLTPCLFDGNLTAFKIEIMMANAEVLAPKLYENDIQLIFPQIFEFEGEKYDQLMYCINQMSIHLPQEDVQNFLIEVQELLTEELNPIVFKVLLYFMNNTCQEFQPFFMEIFQLLVKNSTVQDQIVAENINEILTLILNIQQDSDQYLQLLITCLGELEGEIYSMNIEQGIAPYMQVLQYSLQQGRDQDFDNGLELLNIIINSVDECQLEPFMPQIFGLLVRTLNYKREPYVKKKIITMLDFFQDQPQAPAYAQQILYTYTGLLRTKVASILKELVKSMLEIMGTVKNPHSHMAILIRQIMQEANECNLYCLYELVKVKGAWFEVCHREILACLEALFERELNVNCRILLGKILGLLLKKNYSVADMLMRQKQNIAGDEVTVQNATYFYVLTCANMIRKSQDMLPVKEKNFGLLELTSTIKNQARLDQVYKEFSKLVDRPELAFLNFTKEEVAKSCRQ